MGEAGRTFALGRFDAKVMVDALERVYREAIAETNERESAPLGAGERRQPQRAQRKKEG